MCFYIFLNNKERKSSISHSEIYCNICKSKKYLVKMKCNHTICIKCISKTNYYDNDKCIQCIE
jgi:hypothetical protein